MNKTNRAGRAVGVTSAALAAASALVAAVAVAAPAVAAGPRTITVQPGQSVQAAVDQAAPGDTVALAAGLHAGPVVFRRDGQPGAPITLTGPDAALVSDGHVVDVDANHITLTDVTLYGQPGIGWREYPQSPSLAQARAFKESMRGRAVDSRLIYIGRDRAGVTGVVVDRVTGRGAGGECVRMRQGVTGNTVSRSVFDWCGMFAKDREGKDPWHNGEAVYIGTSPKSTSQPMHDRDTSSGNTVRASRLEPWGSECFNVKENAHSNTLTGSLCAGNIESGEHGGSLVELRGPGNTVLGNTYGATAGARVKVKADPGYSAAGNRVDGQTQAQGVQR